MTSHGAVREASSARSAAIVASHASADRGGVGALTLVVAPSASMIEVFTRVAPGTSTMRSRGAVSPHRAKRTSSAPRTTTAAVSAPPAERAAETFTPLPLTSRV